MSTQEKSDDKPQPRVSFTFDYDSPIPFELPHGFPQLVTMKMKVDGEDNETPFYIAKKTAPIIEKCYNNMKDGPYTFSIKPPKDDNEYNEMLSQMLLDDDDSNVDDSSPTSYMIN